MCIRDRDAACLGRAIAAAGPALAATSLEVALERYVARGAAVDQAHRALEQRWQAANDPQLPEYDSLRARVQGLRELWHAWADTWARDFGALCQKQGFLPPPALQQRMLFDDVVRPLVHPTEVTAVFLVDALRFEMAAELQGMIDDLSSTTIELRARYAELPTVTAVGMNALAPVSEHGAQLHRVAQDPEPRGRFEIDRVHADAELLYEDEPRCRLENVRGDGREHVQEHFGVTHRRAERAEVARLPEFATARGAIRLEVADTGAGMDARTRERALDSFYTTRPQGSGLGLAFVRRVVDAHGGELGLTSEEGRGTVVRVRLPA